RCGLVRAILGPESLAGGRVNAGRDAPDSSRCKTKEAIRQPYPLLSRRGFAPQKRTEHKRHKSEHKKHKNAVLPFCVFCVLSCASCVPFPFCWAKPSPEIEYAVNK